jgi:hypothetical protein
VPDTARSQLRKLGKRCVASLELGDRAISGMFGWSLLEATPCKFHIEAHKIILDPMCMHRSEAFRRNRELFQILLSWQH